ncbi:MAG TPA: GNAT family N-acetyltransferase [Spirochaetia bacterium]|nr:GNAT family N-acetyltransferase [Spirochaetia bacterium]
MIDVLPLREGDLVVFFGLLADIYPEGPIRSQLLLEQCGLLQPDFHPALNHIDYELFLAWDGKRPAGRVAAIIDTHYPDPGVGFFGLFEAHRNQEAALKLLQAAENWLRSRGKTVMLGPVAFNPNEKAGALIDGFDQPPQPSIPFNPPYYRELLEGAGLEKEIDLLAYLWDPEGAPPAKVSRVAARARQRIPGLVLRHLNGEDIVRESRAIGEVYNNCMKAGWGFVPLTEGELDAFLQGLATQSQGIYILADTATGPAGISLSVPGGPAVLSRDRAATFLRLSILGVISEYQNRGLAAVLIHETIRAYARSGCRQVEFSLVAENNALMNRIVELSDATIARRYRVYRLALD